MSSQDSLNVQGDSRKVSVRVMQWEDGFGFEDGKRPEAKECRQFLEAGKDKETDCPLGSRKEPALLAL